MVKKIRLGIIGFGVQGSYYASVLSEGKISLMELGGICDISSDKRTIAAEKYPDIPIFDHYINMIESGKVDAVITTVPHYFHPVMGIEAIHRNMPVICEKPAGVYTKQVRHLIEESKKKPEVPFAIMFNQRTNPLYQEIKKLVEGKVIGEIRRVNWMINSWWRTKAYYDSSSWRATWGAEGGGVLVNQAPHQLDMIQWICGKPKRVFAKAIYGAHRDIAVENDVTATLTYENGATGCFITCTHDPMGTDRFEIDGNLGKIVVDNSNRAVIRIFKHTEEEMGVQFSQDRLNKLLQGKGEEGFYTKQVLEFPSAWGSQHCLVMENFADHILNGVPLLAQGEEGMNGVRLANAMLLSSWLGQEVDYEFDEDLYIQELNKRILEEGKYPLITP